MASDVRSWVEGGHAYLEAHFPATSEGLAEARAAEQKLAAEGFVVVRVTTTGSQLRVGRSVGKSLLGLGLLKATGIGFVGTSRDAGQIAVTFEKRGPSLEDAQLRQRLAAAAQQTEPTVLATHPEMSPGRLRGSAKLLQSESIRGGVRLHVLATNTQEASWAAFELEAVIYRPADGHTIRAVRQRFAVPVAPNNSQRAVMTILGLPNGDAGVLVAVTGALTDGAWQ